MTIRVDYDQIAELYDSQPYRSKTVDPDLLTFLEAFASRGIDELAILDIGCGTGNQLVANRTYLPTGLMIGLDLFYGMLRQAAKKADNIAWVQGDGARLPFGKASFDFITNQFSFHHVQDKPMMIREVFRVLRPGARFVMANISPQEMPDWIYYRYFPEAQQRDFEDFMPRDEIVAHMQSSGFAGVKTELNPQEYEVDLRDFAESVKRRDTCSQLLCISDAAYREGVQRINRELQHADPPTLVPTGICLLKVIGDKPRRIDD